jgi:chromosome segregation ATPase
MKGWVVSFTALLLFACANTQNMRVLNTDLGRLQSQINLIQRESSLIRNEISDMRAKSLDLKTDLSLLLDNLESEFRILSTSVEEYKEFLKRAPEEIYRFHKEMSDRLGSEENRRNQGERVSEIENYLQALDSKTDRLLIQINSLRNQ